MPASGMRNSAPKAKASFSSSGESRPSRFLCNTRCPELVGDVHRQTVSRTVRRNHNYGDLPTISFSPATKRIAASSSAGYSDDPYARSF